MLPVLSWGSRADFPVRFGRWRPRDELVVFVAELMPSTGPLWTAAWKGCATRAQARFQEGRSSETYYRRFGAKGSL